MGSGARLAEEHPSAAPAARPTEPPSTAQEPAVLEPPAPASKRRMLIIVNPYAATVSDRLRHLVVYALQGRYEVDAVDTEARGDLPRGSSRGL